jgi:hypothetical protein
VAITEGGTSERSGHGGEQLLSDAAKGHEIDVLRPRRVAVRVVGV